MSWSSPTVAASGVLPVLEPAYLVLLYAMLAATVGSGVQYTVKAVRLLRRPLP